MDTKDAAEKGFITIEEHLAALSHKPFNTNWLLLLILVVSLTFGTYYCTKQVSEYEAKVKEAKAAQEIAEKEKKDVESSAKARVDNIDAVLSGVVATQKAIIDVVKAQGQLAERTKTRDQSAAKTIEEVASDTRTNDQSLEDLSKHLDIKAKLINADFILTQPDIKKIVAIEIDRQRLREDLKDAQSQLALEQEKTKKLSDDLQRAIDALNDSKKTIDDYKHLVGSYEIAMKKYQEAAVKSKWVKARDIGIKVGLVVASGYLGSLMAH